MGYSLSQKAYKVFSLKNKPWFTYRDIIFHESHFPYHTTQAPTLFPTNIYLPVVTSTNQFTEEIDLVSAPSAQVNNHVNESTSAISSPIHSPIHSDLSVPTDGSNVHDLSDVSNFPELSTLRKSTRIHKPPSYLSSYKCNMTSHWCNLVLAPLKPVSKCTIKEPKSYKEAAEDPLWVQAMQTELTALDKNHTWDLVPLPVNKKTIGSKWVFKVKLKSDGTLERCKARLVAKRYNQRLGIDYEETFSTIIKMSTVRILLAIAASKDWQLHQLDVNNPFLHGYLKEEVYMRVPEGIPNPHNLVCLLRRSIYGLKQASREWHAKLVEELLDQNFIQSKNDSCLFTKKTGDRLCIAAVYVDDVILTRSDEHGIKVLKDHLDNKFGIKDLGELHYFLGIEVTKIPQGLILCQQKFAKELLEE